MTGDPRRPGSGDDGMAPDRVEQLVKHILGVPITGPVRWSELPAAEAELIMLEVGRWVLWLVTRYQIDSREIPPCWWRHGSLVEEITALWGSWRVAYEGDQSAAAMADWHGIFHEARLRLREWTSRTGCSAQDHRDGVAPPWAGRPWWDDFNAGLQTGEAWDVGRLDGSFERAA